MNHVDPSRSSSASPPLPCPTKFNVKYIARAWALIARDGAPREVRILKTEKDGTVSGIFTDAEQVAAEIARWDGVKSIYLTVNPLKPEMLARENVGKLTRWTKDTTADKDIVSRAWFIVDIDPVTPVKHVSATEAERDIAIEVRDRLAAWLRSEYAFPDPVRGQSGNGGRLLYAVDLPNDGEATDLIKRCLQALALHWDVPGKVEIDKGVFNASRVDKIWGTMAVKGASTSDRPYRRAFLDAVPALVTVTREQLERLAALAPAREAKKTAWVNADAGEDFPELLNAIRAKGLYLTQTAEGHFITCPWKDAHSVDSGQSQTLLYEPSADNGHAGGFKCQHSHCTERKIGDVYALFIPPVPKPILGSGATGRFMPKADPEAVDPGGERYTDAMCAGLLGERHHAVLRHADEMRAMWHHWDGHRLAVQSEGTVFPYVITVARALFDEALEEDALTTKDRKNDPHAARATMLRKAATRLEGLAGLRAVATVAREHPKLKIRVAQLDQHPYWLNTPGATVDLETGATWPNRIEDLLTKVTGARYDPTATCPQWLKFLERILPDEAVREFLQRSIGYALTDDTSERCLWFLYGIGRNGKTTFLDVVRDALGDYASNTASSTLMVKAHGDDRRNDIAVLRGARFVTASESEEGQRLAESLIKQLAGGEDKITARLMYAEYFTFKPTFKILLATNAKPIIRGTDPAIWDRVRLVPFEVRIPEQDVDKALPGTLKSERDGILNWALAGYRAWREQGLCPPPAVTVATAEYRKEMDHLGGFIEERCVKLDSVRGISSHLYAAYQSWCTASGIRYPMTQRAMSLALQGRGFMAKMDGHGRMAWFGLGLKPDPSVKGDPDREPF